MLYMLGVKMNEKNTTFAEILFGLKEQIELLIEKFDLAIQENKLEELEK